jgi:hypothetical protein
VIEDGIEAAYTQLGPPSILVALLRVNGHLCEINVDAQWRILL